MTGVFGKSRSDTETWRPAAAPTRCVRTVPLQPGPLLGTPHAHPTASSCESKPVASPDSAQSGVSLCVRGRHSPPGLTLLRYLNALLANACCGDITQPARSLLQLRTTTRCLCTPGHVSHTQPEGWGQSVTRFPSARDQRRKTRTLR